VRAGDEAGGGLPVSVRPRPLVDAFAVKIDEWVDRSRGRIRADVAHQRLVAMGYRGSERATRRAVAEAKRCWRAEHGVLTRLKHDPATRAYAARRASEGKTPREIKRCLKRYVARRLFRTLEAIGPHPLKERPSRSRVIGHCS